MKLLALLALVAGSAVGQVGGSPKEVSPEIVQQMKLEARQAFTLAERAEFKKLHAADAEMFQQMAVLMQRVALNAKRYDDLDKLLGNLDTTISTRTLMMLHTTAILDLQKNDKRREEDSKAWGVWFWSIASALIVLWVTQLLKWKGDSKAAETRDEMLADRLIARIEEAAESKALQRHAAMGLK